MSKESSKKINDNQQNKSRILRAQDIIPGSPKVGSKKAKACQKKTSLSPDETSAGQTDSHLQASNIPKFDLAEKIMAEQRKITAIKRKRSHQKAEAQDEPRELKSVGYPARRSRQKMSQQEKIIADIVSRDIEKLCSSRTLDT